MKIVNFQIRCDNRPISVLFERIASELTPEEMLKAELRSGVSTMIGKGPRISMMPTGFTGVSTELRS